MKYNKFVAPLMAGALSLSLGLVGCGGNKAATETTTEVAETTEAAETTAETTEATGGETTEATTEAAGEATAAASDTVVFWSGETTDGDSVLYSEDEANSTATILLFGTHDGSDEILGASGPAQFDGNKVAITDSETGSTFEFTITNRTEGGIDVDLGEHGTGTLIATTEAGFQQDVENTINEVGAAIDEAISNISVKDLREFSDKLSEVVSQMEAEENANAATDGATATDSATTTN